jgi:endopolyphosphatase
MRDRGVSAILIGHVPPARVNSKESWEETCWQKYALWKRQYRDVIVASLFGHMNMDHFMLQDFKQIKKSTNKGKMATKRISNREASGGLLEDGEVTVASSTDYLLDLRKKWSKLPSPESKKGKGSIMDVDVDEEERENPIWKAIVNMLSKPKKGGKGDEKPHQRKTYLDKIGGQYAERYSVSLVSPSVVPNYFPTLRILEYNITGLEDALIMPVVSNTSPQTPHYSSDQQQLLTTDSDLLDDSANNREVETAVKKKQKDKQKSSLKKPRKYKFTLPKPPSKSSPPGPAYSPQPLTLLGYTQYVANLTYINNDFVEDTDATSPSPFSPHTIFGLAVDADGEVESRGWKEGKHGKYQGKKPRPEPHPNKFEYEVEYDTKTDERWGLKDLTVRRWVEMARRIGGKVEKAKASDAFKQDEREEEEKEEEEDEGYESAESDELEKDEQDDEDEDEHEERHVNPLTTKGKKHKHKKKHGKNSAWYMFVSRAFVGTMDPREIEEVFGAQEEEHTAGLRDEVIEL